MTEVSTATDRFGSQTFKKIIAVTIVLAFVAGFYVWSEFRSSETIFQAKDVPIPSNLKDTEDQVQKTSTKTQNKN